MSTELMLRNRPCATAGCMFWVHSLRTGLCFVCGKLADGFVFDETLKKFVKPPSKKKKEER